jgi:hypothetical protein
MLFIMIYDYYYYIYQNNNFLTTIRESECVCKREM